VVVDGLLGTASRVAWGLDLAVDMPMSVGAAMGPVRSNGSAIPGGGSAAASAVHAGSGVSSHAGAHSASMGTMSMTVGSHATNILPSWLAVGWTLVFLAILAVHGRHALDSDGQRRQWHIGHVLMALGMAFMFALFADAFSTPTGLWSAAFAGLAIAVVLSMIVMALAGRGTNPLWLLMAIDLAAMAYMWSPSGPQAAIAWPLVAYFAWQAALWSTNWMRRLDGRTIFGGAVGVTAEGALVETVAEPLICHQDLRVSMAAMTLGMAYMFAAMQLLT
jgi:hypothetical protein